MTGTNCDLFTHNQSRSYLNHLVFCLACGFLFPFVQIKYVSFSQLCFLSLESNFKLPVHVSYLNIIFYRKLARATQATCAGHVLNKPVTYCGTTGGSMENNCNEFERKKS
jgi:hypothetical protein